MHFRSDSLSMSSNEDIAKVIQTPPPLGFQLRNVQPPGAYKEQLSFKMAITLEAIWHLRN